MDDSILHVFHKYVEFWVHTRIGYVNSTNFHRRIVCQFQMIWLQFERILGKISTISLLLIECVI